MRISIVAVAAILGLAAGVAPASAAPQVLMVVTPTDTLPMNCEGGVCSSEVAAICLQPDRANPVRGKQYRVIERTAQIPGVKSSNIEDTMILVGIAADGRQISLPTWKHLRIRAERDHFAVTLSVDASVLRQYSLKSLSVRVTGNALLFPDAVDRDPEPQTDADIAVARTTLRGVAKRILGQRADTLGGAKVVRSAMNALPRNRATTTRERRAARQIAAAAPATPRARTLAGEAFEACRNVSDLAIVTRYDSRYSYRDCLGIMHDDLIDGVNKQYWDALKAGS
jgi:hypothetical protein